MLSNLNDFMKMTDGKLFTKFLFLISIPKSVVKVTRIIPLNDVTYTYYLILHRNINIWVVGTKKLLT